jgi:putative salt-induced outer membrane protein
VRPLGALRGEQDRFSGFSYQATLSTGVGYRFVASESLKLTGTLGAGCRRLRPEILIKSPAGEVLERIKGDATGDAVANAGLSYEQKLTPTTTLVDKFLVDSGSSNTLAQNDFSVQVSMTEVLALSVGYGLRYNSDPPAGAQTTDQLTTVNLVYQIK